MGKSSMCGAWWFPRRNTRRFEEFSNDFFIRLDLMRWIPKNIADFSRYRCGVVKRYRSTDQIEFLGEVLALAKRDFWSQY